MTWLVLVVGSLVAARVGWRWRDAKTWLRELPARREHEARCGKKGDYPPPWSHAQWCPRYSGPYFGGHYAPCLEKEARELEARAARPACLDCARLEWCQEMGECISSGAPVFRRRL